MATLFDTAAITSRPLRPHQSQGIAMLRKSIAEGNKRIVVQMPTGSGKCLGFGTPVLMADGTIKPVECVKVGDRLASPTGQPRTVLSLARGREQLFRVIPVRGDPYVVNASHLLSLRRTPSRDVVTLSSGERITPDQDMVIVRADVFYQSNNHAKHILKGWRAAIDTFEGQSKELSIPPYILGIWLGDGSYDAPEISKPEGPMVKEWCAYGESIGLKVSVYDSERCPRWCITNGMNGGRRNKFIDLLKELKVFKNKHIPHKYKTAHWQDRLEILAGLLDSDGHMSRSGYDFISKDRSISEDVCFIARSLGLAAYVKVCKKQIKSLNFVGIYWRCSISGDCSIIPCRQKIAPDRKQIKRVTVTGIKLEPMGLGDYYGFELDGDRLFMLGDFTVTHNTRFAAEIVNGALNKGNKVAFTVPAISLIDQTIESFSLEGIEEVGVMQASHERTHYGMPVQICSVQTIAKRFYPDASIVIVDEAHLRFSAITNWMKQEPGKIFVGLSATPWSRGMADDWQDLVVPVQMQELIDQKYLSPFRVYAPNHPDLSSVRTTAGDYNEKDLSDVMGDNILIADIVHTWLKLGNWEPTLVFAVDRAHAAKLQAEFQACGVPMGYCDAFTDRVERKVLFQQMAAKKIAGIVNVGTLTTGVDADVRCIVLARPTKSEMLHVQIVGRGLRTAPGKSHCIILDHADNHNRLGFVTDIHHEKLLTGKEKNKTKKEKNEPLPKECPACQSLKVSGVKECPFCGFVPTVRSDIETIDGELVEVTKGGKKAIPTMAEKADFMSQVLWVAQERGRSAGWASHVYRDRYGVWPVGEAKHVEAKPASLEVLSFIKSKDIRFAKSKKAAAA